MVLQFPLRFNIALPESIGYILTRQSLLSLHMTKSYVRTATHTTLKVEANLTQILNFKANFHGSSNNHGRAM